MTTTPTGVPAQVRAASIEDYGGHADKYDYQAQGVVNPLTDVSAAQFLRLTADLAACARVAPFCVLTVECNDTTPAAPTVIRIEQMGIVSTLGYEGDAPPDVNLPTLARINNGAFTVTWPATTTDDYGVEADVSLVHVFGQTHGENLHPGASITGGNVLTVAAVNSGGSALSDATVTIEVG